MNRLSEFRFLVDFWPRRTDWDLGLPEGAYVHGEMEMNE